MSIRAYSGVLALVSIIFCLQKMYQICFRIVDYFGNLLEEADHERKRRDSEKAIEKHEKQTVTTEGMELNQTTQTQTTPPPAENKV